MNPYGDPLAPTILPHSLFTPGAPGNPYGGATGGTGGPTPRGGNTTPGSGGGSSPAPATPRSTGSMNGNPLFDLFGTSAQWIAVRQAAGQNFMTSYYIKKYNCLRCDLYFNDLSGGVDAQIRQIADGVFTNELAASLLNSGFSRTLILPPLVTADTGTTNAIDTLEAMSSCYLNDGGTPRWLAAAGDTADKALFALTTVVTKQTYTPGSNIVSLTATPLVTNTERVIVGRAGAAAQVLTGFNGTPTTSGTMHANTTQLWGCIKAPLNSTTAGAYTLLLYCNDGLYSLSSATSAIGDAPTAVLTNWPGGGYALGIATLGTEGVARAYWVHPLNDLSVSMLDAMSPGKIVSTDLEGTDSKEVLTGLPFIKHALLWRGGIVATDGKQVVWINGDGAIVDLGWNKERRWGVSDYLGFGTVQKFDVIGPKLFVTVASTVSDVNDYNDPAMVEEYILEENKWIFVVKASPSAGLVPNVSACTGRSAAYQPSDTNVDAGVFWWYTKVGGGLIAPTYQWNSIPLLANGINPMYQQREGAHIAYQFATGAASAAYAITPAYDFMGLPLIVSDIRSGATFRGTDSQVTIEIATSENSAMSFPGEQVATFKQSTHWQRNWWINPALSEAAPQLSDHLQLKIAIIQGTSGTYVSKTSPSALPFRVGFYVFMDGNYTSPQLIEPDRYWGPKEMVP